MAWAVLESLPWRKLACPRSELRLDIVLRCGQSFRWRQSPVDPNNWQGVMRGRLWLLSQDQENIFYKSVTELETGNSDVKDEDILKDYFQLEVNYIH